MKCTQHRSPNDNASNPELYKWSVQRIGCIVAPKIFHNSPWSLCRVLHSHWQKDSRFSPSCKNNAKQIVWNMIILQTHIMKRMLFIHGHECYLAARRNNTDDQIRETPTRQAIPKLLCDLQELSPDVFSQSLLLLTITKWNNAKEMQFCFQLLKHMHCSFSTASMLSYASCKRKNISRVKQLDVEEKTHPVKHALIWQSFETRLTVIRVQTDNETDNVMKKVRQKQSLCPEKQSET